MKNNHGGKRKRAGRNELPQGDKKIPIRIFPQQSKVETLGGEQEVKKILMKYIERTAVKAVRQKGLK